MNVYWINAHAQHQLLAELPNIVHQSGAFVLAALDQALMQEPSR